MVHNATLLIPAHAEDELLVITPPASVPPCETEAGSSTSSSTSLPPTDHSQLTMWYTNVNLIKMLYVSVAVVLVTALVLMFLCTAVRLMLRWRLLRRLAEQEGTGPGGQQQEQHQEPVPPPEWIDPTRVAIVVQPGGHCELALKTIRSEADVELGLQERGAAERVKATGTEGADVVAPKGGQGPGQLQQQT